MSSNSLTFSVDTEEEPNVQFVCVTGEADMTAAPHLEGAIRAASEKAPLVVVDLTAATFIDSRTIGVLVNWTQDLDLTDGRLTVVCTDPNMLRVFRQIGLDQTLHIVDSRPPAEH